MARKSKTRVLKDVLPHSPHVDALIQHVVEGSHSEPPAAASPDQVKKAALASKVADLTNNNTFAVSKIIEHPQVESLRDAAYVFDHATSTELARETVGSTSDDLDGDALHTALFHAEPTAVIHRLVDDQKIDLEPEVRSGVSKFLARQPALNLRKESVLPALASAGAFDGIPKNVAPKVAEKLKTIQRVQALAPDPKTVSVLLNKGITSAQHASQMPRSKFVQKFKNSLGTTLASQVHDHAVVSNFRNDQAALQIHQAVSGSGLAVIDGGESVVDRKELLRLVAKKRKIEINLESIFGDVNYCECDDCTTVLSPANYFVELLQYLRNNDLDPDRDGPGNANTGTPGYANTALEVLLRRRPDLQHLQLTCENANTLIPYIDLANEVMESFIVHLDTYPDEWTSAAQATIDVFNVTDETSSELAAEPQHTNYKAYCILRQAVYPLGTLPFHQPIAAIRIYLDFLKTSRYEVVNVFRRPFVTLEATPPFSAAEQSKLRQLHDEICDRAADAEYLGIIQEEYIILTKEAFWPREYFAITSRRGNSLTDSEYQDMIGVKKTKDYWGYRNNSLMLDEDAYAKIGLMFAKAQFLKRSGMVYVDLVSLVQTRYVNPVYPTGKSLDILESIRYSYRFLETLVDQNTSNKTAKFKRLITFLENALPWPEEAIPDASAGQEKQCRPEITSSDICDFIYRWFDCLGKLVVLESGDKPTIDIHGTVAVPSERSSQLQPESSLQNHPISDLANVDGRDEVHSVHGYDLIGTLYTDGTITDNKVDSGKGIPRGNVLARVALDGKAYTPNGELFTQQYRDSSGVYVIRIVRDGRDYYGVEKAGFDNETGVLRRFNSETGFGKPVRWNPIVESCNINNVRIMHLDGTSLALDEWDRIQRFIRLWKRLGWSVDETDKALLGLARPNASQQGQDHNKPELPRPVGSEDFAPEDCTSKPGEGGCGHTGSCACDDKDPPEDICKSITLSNISTAFIGQAVRVKKVQDLTGVDVTQLLALWSDISTVGDQSLYSRLFLTHDLVGIDPVFTPNANGNFLTTSTLIRAHLPVIMAALRLNPDSLTAILKHMKLIGAHLTLSSISAIYRFTLLAQMLVTQIPTLIGAIELFGNPFENAEATLTFVNRFNTVYSAGFTIQQLLYAVHGVDDIIRPLGPQLPDVIKATKDILDGLDTIETQHPDIAAGGTTPIVIDTVTQNTTLYFDSTLVSQINGLLQGTTIYTTNAPVGLFITVPSSLSAKFSYVDPTSLTGTLRVAHVNSVGILTSDEESLVKSLSSAPGWSDAIDRLRKQALTFYKTYIAAIFPNQLEATSVLLAGDIVTPATVQPPPTPSLDTAPIKIAYFLKYFMGYLRDQLSNQLVINIMAGQAGISSLDITSALLQDILTVPQASSGQPQSALSVLKHLKDDSSPVSGNWNGYLIPPTTDAYIFIGIGDTQPAPIVLDGTPQIFKYQQDDPNNVWSTDPVALIGGRLYLLDAGGQSVPGLQWKTARSAISAIPSTALLAKISTSSTMGIFVAIRKAAIVINGFNLSLDEINFFQTNSANFAKFDLNDFSMEAWESVSRYSKLKLSLPPRPSTLLDLFKWASGASSSTPPTPGSIAEQIQAVTNWGVADVQTIISPDDLNLATPSLFVNQEALLKIQTALAVVSKTRVDIPSLFKWANPLAKFWPSHDIAVEIHDAIRARYSLSDWEQAAVPLHNELRMLQRDALVAYLLVQPKLNGWGIVDADSLFEFFLIDVQMGACLQTSRLKQAISTVQLFVQRCILGLEEEKATLGYPTVRNDTLDQTRWTWMSKQPIWTANRKAFLTPENYIVGSLRDDKSPLYLDLENDMLQKDASASSMKDSLKNYIFGLDQIANLRVEGIFQDNNDPQKTVYFVARTMSPPYFYFFRSYAQNLWTPWQSLSADIPNYHVDDTATRAAHDGCYVTPVVLDGRFIVFFAQITLKTVPLDLSGTNLTNPGTVTNVSPTQTWEIKIGWTENQNGKWSHKQISAESITDPNAAVQPPPLDGYRFVPQVLDEPSGTGGHFIRIGVYNASNTALGGFEFHGSQISSIGTTNLSSFSWNESISFHYAYDTSSTRIYSLQLTGSSWDLDSSMRVQYPFGTSTSNPFFQIPGSVYEIFNHRFSSSLMSVVNSSSDLGRLFSIYRDQDVTASDIFGISGYGKDTTFSELAAPYPLYNWEVGFHAPMELAGSLLENQQFDDALKMVQYVFNPYADGVGKKRVWQWPPFADLNTTNVLNALFDKLKPNTPDAPNGPINSWRDNPFEPHVVARQRPVAYMKWTVMTYIQILIAYGDWYFRQNSLEAVPLAIQCYVLASHIYGPRAQQIPPRGVTKPETYFSLLDKWDAFSNAVVDLELEFPFSNQVPDEREYRGGELVLANIFGFATAKYFTIPGNPQLTALRDLIDDRLYKIRHCQDINGNAISLALWDPPIDPAALVAAVAQGLSLSNFLNDLDSPMPNYRFYFILQKALELCGEIKALGNSFLSIKEKRDTEALQLLRAKQDNTIQSLIMKIRTLQIDEATKTLDALSSSRETPLYRYKYYTALAGATPAALADTDADYTEIALTLLAPVSADDLVLTANEKNEIDEAKTAKDINDQVGALELFAAHMLMIPPITLNVQPWGCGLSTSIGTNIIAEYKQAEARSKRIDSDNHTFGSTSASRKSTFIKQYQERIQQANVAGYELLNINKQMVTQQSRIATANQEITNQQAQIDNAAETLEFLQNKYTNDQLYAYLESSVRGLFYQSYTLAYDLAKKAEAAYIFERGPQPTPFIQFGYWDASRDGLQSGERLYVALKQLEAAYQADRGHDFEVVKQISIRQLNPWALLSLREKATCQIAIPEVLFDMDFPGHYFRRIKSVSITIPCIVGPYTNINATLRLLESTYRTNPTAKDVNSYLPQTSGGTDPRFQVAKVPIASIAVSSAQTDSGVFELQFTGERYLPFEGAGAISNWQLDLPEGFRQFDYDSITDVVMTIHYTSRDGGDKLKGPASASVAAYIKSIEDLSTTQGLFALFDLRSEFATGWAQFTSNLPTSSGSGSAGSTQPPAPRTLALSNIANRLPLFTKGRDASKIIATDIHLVTATSLPASAYSLSVDPSGNQSSVTFTEDANSIGALTVLSSETDVDVSFAKPWTLNAQLQDGASVTWEKIWMLVRYVLK